MSADGPSVLICDDDAVTRKRIRSMFEKNGYTISGEATTGVETVALSAQKKPDIVLLDIGMPQGSGLTVLPLLLEIQPRLCIIMLTGDRTRKSVENAIQLGAKGYIVKETLDETHLFSIIRQAALSFPADSPANTVTDRTATIPTKKSETVSTHNAKPIQSCTAVYITGGPYTSESGTLFFYHPISADYETGSKKDIVRELLGRPDYFLSLFDAMEGFNEIHSLLYEQEFYGSITELMVKAIPAKQGNTKLTFAYRQYDAAELIEYPLGVAANGAPFTIQDEIPPSEFSFSPIENLLSDDFEGVDRKRYFRSFEGSTIELCLFLSTFNLLEINRYLKESPHFYQKTIAAIDETRKHSKTIGIPKAVLFGPYTIIDCPDSNAKYVATSSLSNTLHENLDRIEFYYWLENHRMDVHLERYLMRWSLDVIPLVQLEDFGTVSLLFSRDFKHRFGVTATLNPGEIFHANRYNTIALPELTRRLETIQLRDLMAPLYINTMLARNPGMRVDASIQSHLDTTHYRDEIFQSIVNGDGLQYIERANPFLFREAQQELATIGFDSTNTDYIKELVRRIVNRYSTLRNLPAPKAETPTLTENEYLQRRRIKEAQIIAKRFKAKYGDP